MRCIVRLPDTFESIKSFQINKQYIYTLMFLSVDIATLTRSIHNGDTPTIELWKNLDLMQQTWLATSDPSFPFKMKIFDQQINASMRRTISSRLSVRQSIDDSTSQKSSFKFTGFLMLKTSWSNTQIIDNAICLKRYFLSNNDSHLIVQMFIARHMMDV
jgi:hypothetical protein